MTSKEYYRTYQADDEITELNHRICTEIMSYNPVHVFEFGCGSGKNLKLLEKIQTNYSRSNLITCGLDISTMNVLTARISNKLNFLIHGDETHLRNLVNFDVVFTCSVLDHIQKPFKVIEELKRICNKALIIAETSNVRKEYYYPHSYEDFGFEPTGYSWMSNYDGGLYHIWKWEKEKHRKKYIESVVESAHDDLGMV